MGKKHRKDKAGSRKINVEIAPGNQAAMDRHIVSYNHREDRTTPKIGYTDLVNEALDRFLRSAAGRGRRGEKERSGRK
jgi:hypothetical protein